MVSSSGINRVQDGTEIFGCHEVIFFDNSEYGFYRKTSALIGELEEFSHEALRK